MATGIGPRDGLIITLAHQREAPDSQKHPIERRVSKAANDLALSGQRLQRNELSDYCDVKRMSLDELKKDPLPGKGALVLVERIQRSGGGYCVGRLFVGIYDNKPSSEIAGATCSTIRVALGDTFGTYKDEGAVGSDGQTQAPGINILVIKPSCFDALCDRLCVFVEPEIKEELRAINRQFLEVVDDHHPTDVLTLPVIAPPLAASQGELTNLLTRVTDVRGNLGKLFLPARSEVELRLPVEPPRYESTASFETLPRRHPLPPVKEDEG